MTGRRSQRTRSNRRGSRLPETRSCAPTYLFLLDLQSPPVKTRSRTLPSLLLIYSISLLLLPRRWSRLPLPATPLLSSAAPCAGSSARLLGEPNPLPRSYVSNIPSSPAKEAEAVALNIRPHLTKCGARGEVISTTFTRSRARDLSTPSSSSHASAANLLAREQQALGEYKALQRDEDPNMLESLGQLSTQSCRASLSAKISEHTRVRVASVKPPDASAPGSKVGRWIKRLRAGWKA